MKKLLVLFVLFIIPAFADAAPSVRMLGNNQTGGASGTKIVPAKATQANLNNLSNTSARAGTLKTKTSGAGAGAVAASNARFPVITSAKVYNNVTTPTVPTNPGGSTGGNTGGNSGGGSANVDVNAIVDTVTNRIQNNYYNKNETYNKDEVDARVNEINNSITEINNNINNQIDDVRFDTIRTSNPRNVHNADAPAGHVYIWIEE